MKILYITAVLKKGDGVSHVVRDLAKQACNKGHTVHIVTGQHNTDFEIPSSCTVTVLPSLPIPFYSEYSFPLFVKRETENIIDTFSPDIVHVHSPDPASYFAKQYAIKKGIRIIATHHSDFLMLLPYFSLNFLRSLVASLLKKFYRNFDAITVPSEDTRSELKKLGINSRTIFWGIDTQKFNPARRTIRVDNSKIVILCVGRLVWYKGYKTFIDACTLLRNRGFQISVTVAGVGPIENELRMLYPEINLVGNVKDETLFELFASSDIFLFPSIKETFGRVTLEAMASGLPVVASNSGGSKSLVVDGVTGLLAEPENPQSFADQVERLILDSDLRNKISANALAFAQKQTWEQVFETFEEVYKKEAR